MSKTNSNQERVIDYIKSHPGCTADGIASGTKLKKDEVKKIMTSLKKDKVVLAKLRTETKEPATDEPKNGEKNDEKNPSDEITDAKILNQKKVLDFIIANPDSTAKKVCDKLKLDRIVIVNNLGALIRSKQIFMKERGNEKIYAPVSTAVIEKKSSPSVKENTATSPKKKSIGRNHDRYMFLCKEYSKGRLCLALVAQYVLDHKPKSYDALMKIFDEKTIRPYGYGFIRPASEAKKINSEQSGNRTRFFTESSELIKIADKKIKIVAVTNQISGDILNRVLSIVKSLKYVVKVKTK